MNLFAQVVLPVPLRKSFSYRVPERYQKKIKKGSRVLVPFRKNLLTGYVIELSKEIPFKNIELKEIKELLDREPVFNSSFLRFTKKLGDYYFSSWGEILRISLPPSYTIKTRTKIYISEKGKEYLNQDSCRGAEREVLCFLTQRPYTESYLRRKLSSDRFSPLISSLEQKGLVKKRRELRRPPKRQVPLSRPQPSQLEMDYSLDNESRRTAEKIRNSIGINKFSSFLLLAPEKKKNAVYLYLIKEARAAGFKVLFLVPEIEFTERILKDFERKLGEKTAFLHSRLSEKQRELTWKRIKSGEADVVVGPRSVLLSPVEKIGLIILDQEHDDSYYQRESPVYDARVGARLRAEEEKAVLVYGSETPSVELLYQARRNENLFCLNHNQKTTFKKEIIDTREQPGILSQAMKKGIEQRVEKREPVLLFFNRHGYASSLFCSKCDFTPKCKNCEVLLTYYKKENMLACRYCHYSAGSFFKCPECGSRLVPGGGYGIEVLEEELKKSFPKSTIKSFHRFAVKRRQEEERIVEDYKEGRIDILLGTQMLTHQPGLPLSGFVGIFYPESLLRIADFRGSYITFRYIRKAMNFVKDHQKSEFLVQTYLPQSYSIIDAVNEDPFAFYEHELRNRRLLGYPPFAFLAELFFYGRDLRPIAKKSRKLLDIVKRGKEPIEVLGPSFPHYKKLRGRNRVQVIIKAEKKDPLDRVLERIFKEIRARKSVFIYE